jgi:hypothetical protein
MRVVHDGSWGLKFTLMLKFTLGPNYLACVQQPEFCHETQL